MPVGAGGEVGVVEVGPADAAGARRVGGVEVRRCRLHPPLLKVDGTVVVGDGERTGDAVDRRGDPLDFDGGGPGPGRRRGRSRRRTVEAPFT